MPASPSRWKQWGVPIGVAGGLAILLLLSYRPIKTPDGLAIVNDVASYNDTANRAKLLVDGPFKAYDRGDELSDADKSNLRNGAKLFDTMDNFMPTKPGPYFTAGKAYQIISENALADERFRQCISNQQYDTSDAGRATVIEAKNLLSEVRGVEGDWKTAYDLANDASNAIPDSAIYLVTRASAEIQLKRISEAKTDLARAITIDPNNKRARQLQDLILKGSG